jgi:hypothetical protein
LIDSRTQFSRNQGSAAAAKYTQGLHLYIELALPASGGLVLGFLF